jgi:hypothetical protein
MLPMPRQQALHRSPMPLSNGTGRDLEQVVKLGRGAPRNQDTPMVEIKEVEAGFQVSGAHYHEVFHSRFKATMAAYAVALGDATAAGHPVAISLPGDWGETVLIEPGPGQVPQPRA